MKQDIIKYRDAMYKLIESVAIGDCFRWAAKFLGKLSTDADDIPERLVHAVVKAIPGSDASREQYPHAWVENNQYCWDWQHQISGIGGVGRAEFYQQYQPRDIQRYRYTEAIKLAVKNKHWGPWE